MACLLCVLRLNKNLTEHEKRIKIKPHHNLIIAALIIMWMKDLNTDTMLRLIRFYGFVARDVILQGLPDLATVYQSVLKQDYPPSTMKCMMRVLKMKAIKNLIGIKGNNGIRYLYQPVLPISRNQRWWFHPSLRHAQGRNGNDINITYDDACLFTGSIVFGRNLRYIEAKIGQRVVPGSRIYYKTQGNDVDEIVEYMFPLCLGETRAPIAGIPSCLLAEKTYLCCNASGRIHSAINIDNSIKNYK